VDAILSECVCFYWGCPNVQDILDPETYIVLNIDDIEGSLQVIQEAIRNQEWERRIGAIRREKRRILTELQLFPRLERELIALTEDRTATNKLNNNK
jgi:hypothetical protein